MSKRDPRVDAYIAKSAPFARPILEHIRETVHAACPGVEETMKWSFPHFDYKGMLCSMAAFKEHCAMGFWKGELLFGGEAKSGEAMGQMGRITSIKDLPPKKELVSLIKAAAKLNDEGVAVKRERKPKAEIEMPKAFSAALAKNRKATSFFEEFTPGKRREYVEWISEAKTDATRDSRIAQAIEWISEGKPRNWKYIKK